MIIDELYIRNFGKFKDFRLKFTESLNIIYGENEAGKSTVLAFIRQMFYGGRERKRYQPRNGSPASGSLLFHHNGKKYLLERTFGATRRTDVITLKNAETGTLIPVPLKQEPGEWLFDLVEDTFINTVYIGQLACVFNGPKMGGGVVAKLSNLNCSGDEELSFAKTDERLKKAVNALSYRGRGKIPDSEHRLEALEEEQKNLNISLEILHEKKQQLNTLKNENEKAQEHRQNCENYLKICTARRELEEIAAIEKARAQAENKEHELENRSGAADGALNNAKALCRECEKAEAVISSCEKDFSVRNTEYRSLLKQYDEAKAVAEIDFERVGSLAQSGDLNLSDDGAKSPLGVTCGIVACLALTLLCVALSVKTFWFMLPAIASAVGALLLARLRQKNIRKITDGKNAADAAQKELDEILRQAGCADIGELMRKTAELKELRRKISDLKAVMNNVAANHKSAKAEKERLEKNLFETLLPIAEVSEMSEALKIIDGLEGANTRGEKELSAQKARLEAMLRGRSIQALQSRAQVLTEELSKISNLEQFDPEAADDCRRELEKINVEISEKSANIARLEGELEAAGKGEKTPEALKAEIEACRAQLAEYQAYCSAAELARTALSAANEEMSSAFAPAINVGAAKILSEITSGRYDDVRISGELEPAVLDKSDSSFVAKEFLSGGTTDQLYLAMRLAVSEKLFEGGESLPLLMDEAMAQYDDERMAKGIAYLASLPQQVIFFTCQRRELSAAGEYDGVNVVTL